MIGNLRPQLAHPATEEIERAILTTREQFEQIAKRTKAHPHTVTRIAQRLRQRGHNVPRRGRLCATCRLVVIRKPGARSCFDCRLNGEQIKIGPKGCRTENCDRDAYTHGLCRRCYQHKAILFDPSKARSALAARDRKPQEEGGAVRTLTIIERTLGPSGEAWKVKYERLAKLITAYDEAVKFDGRPRGSWSTIAWKDVDEELDTQIENRKRREERRAEG